MGRIEERASITSDVLLSPQKKPSSPFHNLIVEPIVTPCPFVFGRTCGVQHMGPLQLAANSVNVSACATTFKRQRNDSRPLILRPFHAVDTSCLQRGCGESLQRRSWSTHERVHHSQQYCMEIWALTSCVPMSQQQSP